VLIAATALSAGLPLFTANASDLPEVDGLEVVALLARPATH
jgi:predicted nucleic acid-binding protein